MRVMTALQSQWRTYRFADSIADIMAGLVVAAIAIPLGMALAIASGVAPAHGLYTVIIAGSVVAFLGGSRFQVTGPTAAFVVLLLPIVRQFGVGGLLIAGGLAGMLLFLLGWFRCGRWIRWIPQSVMIGFTTGIAVVIGVLQLKDFCGLQLHVKAVGFIHHVVLLFQARHSLVWTEFCVGGLTLCILILWPFKKIPAPLIALGSVSVGVVGLQQLWPEWTVATLGNRFTYVLEGGGIAHGIPAGLPQWIMPWNYPGVDGHPIGISWAVLWMLLPSAGMITLLGGIESLLSACVADRMTQTEHDSDAELMALGIGNILCACFGGIAATGAIARTTTNIRFGARSVFAAIFHALWAVLAVVFFAPWVSFLPMASLAALLMLVAYRMSDWREFLHVLKTSEWAHRSVLLVSFGLTVIFDMVVGVSAGILLWVVFHYGKPWMNKFCRFF